MKNIIIIVFVLLMFGCNNVEKGYIESPKECIETYTLPTKPLIIIEITPVEYSLGDYAYRYKLADQNGYIFYMTEHAAYDEPSKRMIGDTIN